MAAFGRVTKKRYEAGIALVSALVFLVITVIFVGTSLVVSASNKRLSTDNLRTVQAQFVAEAAIERLIFDVWHSDTSEKNKESLLNFRKYLDEDLNIVSGEKNDQENYEFGASKIYSSSDHGDSLENASYTLTVRRADVGAKLTVLRLYVEARIGDANNPLAVRRITEDINIQLPTLPGFALLTNNANCIFCHTSISSLEMSYDKAGKYYDQGDWSSTTNRQNQLLGRYRTKVGALQSLQSDRTKDMHSLVAGTIYTRGTTNILEPSSSLEGIPFQDGSPRLSSDAPERFKDCASDCDKSNQRFYTNYPSEDAPDGELPDKFPLPAIDENRDRVINDSEWQGAIATEERKGKLAGGAKELYETAGSPKNKNASTLTSGTPNGIEGNLILRGTDIDPLVIEDSVYIDGDVVISGRITGNGKIIAKGNIYVVGDLKYACDDDSQDFDFTIAQNCNYGKPEDLPQFGLVAGGNIMVGPYMTPHLGTPNAPAGQLTNTDLSGVSPDDLYRWYLDPGEWPNNGTLTGPNRNDGAIDTTYGLSFSSVEMAIFNQLEYEKALGGVVPRYYSMREGGPIFRCVAKEPLACRHYGVDENGQPSNTPTVVEIPEAQRTGAVISTLSPKNGWLSATNDAQESELELRKLWIENIEQNNRPSGDEALQIDGILYSSNAVFTLAPAKSNIKGQIKLHGALVAADTGILVPGNKSASVQNRTGLNIMYDERLSRFLDISNDEAFIQIRSNFRLLEASYNPEKKLWPAIVAND